MKSITRIASVAVVSALPIVSFAAGTNGIRGIGQTIIDLINTVLVPLLFAVAFLVFIWGITKAYIISNGDEAAVKQGHQLVLWGLIGFFVIISVWGLVNILVDTFGLDRVTSPSTPTVGPLSA